MDYRLNQQLCKVAWRKGIPWLRRKRRRKGIEMNPYEQAQHDSDAAGEDKDCAVRAVSIATGKPYQYVLGAFSVAGRVSGQRSKLFHTQRVLHGLNYVLVEVPLSTIAGSTVRTVPKHLPRRGTFLLGTKGHVLCVQHRKVYDWTEGRLHRVISIHRVERRTCTACNATEGLEQCEFPPVEFFQLPDYVIKYFQAVYSPGSTSYRLHELYRRACFSTKLLCSSCCSAEYEALKKGKEA